jgi:hypothetical protein
MPAVSLLSRCPFSHKGNQPPGQARGTESARLALSPLGTTVKSAVVLCVL